MFNRKKSFRGEASGETTERAGKAGALDASSVTADQVLDGVVRRRAERAMIFLVETRGSFSKISLFSLDPLILLVELFFSGLAKVLS